MTNDGAMRMRPTLRRPGVVAGAALAALLGAASVGANCGADTSQNEALNPDAGGEHSASNSGAGGDEDGGKSPALDAHEIVFDGGGEEDAGDAREASTIGAPFADGGGGTNTEQNCVLDNQVCPGPGGTQCCNGAANGCSLGACGGLLAEGVPCLYDGGTPKDGDAPCQNGLACTGGFCGTNACVPDGTPCGADAGTVCCNDNCNGSICQN